MGDLIAAVLGPLGALLAAIVAVTGAWLLGKRGGRSAARTEREGQDARAYHDGRRKADEADLGLDASDAERIRRLREFADKR